jgi:hypothetical protein
MNENKNRKDHPQTNAENISSDPSQVVDEEWKLDQELRILRKLKLAFAASLPMLEAAQNDLVEMGNRLDRLRIASEQCRAALLVVETTNDHIAGPK